MHHLHHFNFAALGVATAFLWILGAAWYSPALFAKPWMSYVGLTREQTANKKRTMLAGMLSSLAMDFVASFMLFHFIVWSGADSFGHGAFVGFIAWLGFVAAPQFPQGIYEGRPAGLFWINAGYWLVGLALVGGLLAVWQ